MFVVGHKNPDADSICSAIVLSYFLDATPCRQGNLNPETEFILKFWKVDKPKLIKSAKGKKIFIVDHAEEWQSLDDLRDGQVYGVLDHHSISLELPEPMFYFSMPVGSTATIIGELYFRKCLDLIGAKNKKLSKKMAGLLLSAIISDTMNFMSPTTTRLDRQIAKKLNDICKVDLSLLGRKQLEMKFQIGKKDIVNIFKHSLKNYEFANKKIGISTTNIFTSQLFVNERNRLKRFMKELQRKERYDLLLFMMIYWNKKESHFLVFGNKEVFEKTFKVKVKDNEAIVKNVLSRKLQVAPVLEETYENSK